MTETPESPAPAPGWFARLRAGLSRTSSRLVDGIAGALTRRRLDGEAVEALEEALIAADLGPKTAAKITAAIARNRFDKEVTDTEVRGALAAEVATILAPVARPLAPDAANRPHIVLVVGVNGVGKTTTIGKLASRFRAEGKRVVLAAGDTFRAAAVEQLRIWGERAGATVIARAQGADPAGLAFDAIEAARNEDADILLIDTAGRLHNRRELMAELEKVVRVIGRQVPGAPHDTVLVLDATTGQNALSQVETFREMVSVSGLVVTKLDGSARGGVLVALAERFGLPVHAVGVGEGIDDLRPFDATVFARSLMGLAD
ncbi:MAG: signal recognition particle-docking protein FtsY [Alphaproteobacteria bacterium]